MVIVRYIRTGSRKDRRGWMYCTPESSHPPVLVAPDKDATSLSSVPHTQERQEQISRWKRSYSWFSGQPPLNPVWCRFWVDNFQIDSWIPGMARFAEKPRAQSGLIGKVTKLFKHYHNRVPRQEHRLESIHSLEGWIRRRVDQVVQSRTVIVIYDHIPERESTFLASRQWQALSVQIKSSSQLPKELSVDWWSGVPRLQSSYSPVT